MARDIKEPTYRYSLNFSNDEDYIKEFCKKQSNLTDAIRYLIEEDIKKNGIRNLQEYIPAVRSRLDITINVETNPPVENSIEEKRVIDTKFDTKNDIKLDIPDCYKD